MLNLDIWIKPTHWRFGIAKADADYRQTGIACRINIGDRVAHHNRVMMIAAGLSDRHRQMARIGLEIGEAVAPANGDKPLADSEFIEQEPGMSLHFIGTDRDRKTMGR